MTHEKKGAYKIILQKLPNTCLYLKMVKSDPKRVSGVGNSFFVPPALRVGVMRLF